MPGAHCRMRERTALILNCAVLCASLAIAVAFAEVVIRIGAPQNLSGSWRVFTDKGLRVNSSTGRFRHQFKERIVYAEFFEPHLRDTPLASGSVSILTIGDSFTYGWLLDRDDTYVSHLQRFSDLLFGQGTFHFLNAAAGGWGTSDYVAFIEDFGHQIMPDIILVFINNDDIGRSFDSPLFTPSRGDPSSLIRHVREPSLLHRITRAMPGYQWVLEHSHLIQFARNRIVGTRHENRARREATATPIMAQPPRRHIDATQQEAAQFGQALFTRLVAWARDHGARLLVTTTGWHEPAPGRSADFEPTQAFMSSARDFFDRSNVPYYDISPHVYPIVARDPASFSIMADGHPNEEGSLLIATHAWNWFVAQQLSMYCADSNRCD